MNHKSFSHPSKTVGGISFIYGENQTQRYYETTARGVRYTVLQPKGWHYWVIIADRQGALKPLNTAIVESGTYVLIQAGPLYTHSEQTLERWLDMLAQFIEAGGDPWQTDLSKPTKPSKKGD